MERAVSHQRARASVGGTWNGHVAPPAMARLEVPAEGTRLYVDGVAGAIRARVAERSEGRLTVQQALPFLRLDARVYDDTLRAGRIQEVRIAVEEGVPHLVIELSYEAGAPIAPEPDGLASDTVPGTLAVPDGSKAGGREATVPFVLEEPRGPERVVGRELDLPSSSGPGGADGSRRLAGLPGRLWARCVALLMSGTAIARALGTRWIRKTRRRAGRRPLAARRPAQALARLAVITRGQLVPAAAAAGERGRRLVGRCRPAATAAHAITRGLSSRLASRFRPRPSRRLRPPGDSRDPE